MNLLPIPWYPLYSIDITSNSVYSHRNGLPKKLQSYSGKRWHIGVSLFNLWVRKKFYIHQIVMLIKEWPCPLWMEVCHGDWNPLNNDPWNLRYDTHSENVKDMYAHWYIPIMKWRFWNLHHRSLAIAQCDMSWNTICTFESINQAAINTKISKWNISRVCRWLIRQAWWYRWFYLKTLANDKWGIKLFTNGD